MAMTSFRGMQAMTLCMAMQETIFFMAAIMTTCFSAMPARIDWMEGLAYGTWRLTGNRLRA